MPGRTRRALRDLAVAVRRSACGAFGGAAAEALHFVHGLPTDTVSVTVMGLVVYGIIALIPRAMDAHLPDRLFWSALLGGFAVAFMVTTPVNKWKIGRGKGHAVPLPRPR